MGFTYNYPQPLRYFKSFLDYLHHIQCKSNASSCYSTLLGADKKGVSTCSLQMQFVPKYFPPHLLKSIMQNLRTWRADFAYKYSTYKMYYPPWPRGMSSRTSRLIQHTKTQYTIITEQGLRHMDISVEGEHPKVQHSLHEKKGIQTRNRTELDPLKSILKILQLRSDITVKTKRSFFMIMEEESEIPATLPLLDRVGILTGSIS